MSVEKDDKQMLDNTIEKNDNIMGEWDREC
jgi:hypothetical protein